MAVRNDFTAGEVLAAADLNDTFASKVDYSTPTNAQSGTAYTFVADDAQRITTASNGSAVTLTIPPQSSVTWGAATILRVVNYGAGALTIAGGSGVTVTNATKTLAPYESAALVRTGSNAWTLLPFSGGGLSAADFSDAATGTYTDGDGIDWKYKTYTASGNLTTTKAGLMDIMVLGGGAGGMTNNSSWKAGGGGGGLRWGTFTVAATTYTITVGGGGGAQANGNASNCGDVIKVGGGERGFAVTTGDNGVVRAGGGGGAGGALTNGYGHSSGAGAGGTLYGTNNYDGLSLAFTGTSIAYGRGGFAGSSTTANRGEGGDGNASGSSGVIVVRVRTN